MMCLKQNFLCTTKFEGAQNIWGHYPGLPPVATGLSTDPGPGIENTKLKNRQVTKSTHNFIEMVYVIYRSMLFNRGSAER